jgi:DNA polymerase
MPFLMRQIAAIQPEFIVALGGVATQNLLNTKSPISRLRGTLHPVGDLKIMPTYHPAYLLRNPAEKRKVFEDMLVVREAMGITPPADA